MIPTYPVACPFCGCDQFQELAKRHTWQPFAIERNEETGELREGEYREFDYGDDVEVDGVECLECGRVWESLAALEAAMQLAAALSILDSLPTPVLAADNDDAIGHAKLLLRVSLGLGEG